jgi:predicted nucleic acid-binding protein
VRRYARGSIRSRSSRTKFLRCQKTFPANGFIRNTTKWRLCRVWWIRTFFSASPVVPILTVDAALGRLAEQGTALYYTLQNIAELWNVMTRPISSNGLGLSAAEADREVHAIETGMSLLPDNAAVYKQWRNIVVKHNVSGVRVHDARLAAAMYVHGVSHILTLNIADFSRFENLNVIHPERLESTL